MVQELTIDEVDHLLVGLTNPNVFTLIIDVGFLMQMSGDGTEVTTSNRPQDRMLDWFFEPLLTLKEQLRRSCPTEAEERYLEKQVLMVGDTTRMLDWDNGACEPEDEMRRGELQALSRRYLSSRSYLISS